MPWALQLSSFQVPGNEKADICNTFNGGRFAGWGHLVYFDTAEHKTSEAGAIAKIPKLGAEWKIIHEFKPTENIQDGQAVGLSVVRGESKAPGSIFFITAGDFLFLTTKASAVGLSQVVTLGILSSSAGKD